MDITVDGRSEPWGSLRLGLSDAEHQQYDALHRRHTTEEERLREHLGGGLASIREAVRRSDSVLATPGDIRVITRICRSLESIRRALRVFLADPELSLEWTWRYWVGRELGVMRGDYRIDVTPGLRSAWGSRGFTLRPGLSREDRARADILLKEWTMVLDELQATNRPFDFESAFGGGALAPVDLDRRGQLLMRTYACERDLLAFSAYTDATGDLPVARALSERRSEVRSAAYAKTDVLASQVRSAERISIACESKNHLVAPPGIVVMRRGLRQGPRRVTNVVGGHVV